MQHTLDYEVLSLPTKDFHNASNIELYQWKPVIFTNQISNRQFFRKILFIKQ